MILLQAPVTSALESALDTLLTTLVAQHAVFIGLGKALGGFGAIMYIFFRIWAHMARNEEIDVYSLLRPVTLAFCLLFYSQIAAGVIYMSQALDNGTKPLVSSQEATVTQLNTQKDNALDAKQAQITAVNPDLDGENGVSFWETLVNAIPGVSLARYAANSLSFGIAKIVDEVLMKIGALAYFAASIALKFIMTFFLLIMLITGPITFGLANFEWFYGGLSAWVSRVIHLMLWVPIVNILGGLLESVHIIMLKVDIAQINATPNDQFSLSETGMLAFYIMGTAAYLMVPKVASWVVESTGADQGVKSLTGGIGKLGSGTGSLAGAAGGVARSGGKLATKAWNGV